MKEKVNQAVAAIITFGTMMWSPLSDWVRAAGGETEIVAAIMAVYTVVHGLLHYARGGAASMVLLALLLSPAAAAAQEPPVDPAVPVTPIGPSTPVAPEPAPDPVGQQVLASFQLLLDTLGNHDRGAADLAEAEAGVTAAEGQMARAEQRLADVTATRTSSATTLVEHARAVITVLEALILEYAP